MLIDSHCHLPHKKYQKTLPQIIGEAKENGVEKLINIGTSLADNTASLKVSEKYPQVYSTIGIYPHEDKDKSVTLLENELKEQLKLSKKIIDLGECGVDISNWKNGRRVEEQIDLLEMQLSLAVEVNLPVVIHNREGDLHILNALRKFQGRVKGVVHCFSSSWDFAKNILDLGLSISFSGLITYPGNNFLLEVVKKVPEDKFLLETDSPYLPLQGHRGEVNYPEYVRMVAEKCSQIKEKPFEEICQLSYYNTCLLFGI